MNPWRTLAVVLVGAFMALLDTTIVNVALQSIATGLAADATALEWVVSGYALAFGLTLVPAGRLGDAIGRGPVFLVGLALFTACSLACGLAQSSLQLIVFRVLQGLAAGAYYPSITALIQELFQGPARSRAFGVLSATIGVSTAIGPLLGGLLIEGVGVEEGWRAVFLVNIPVGIVAVPVAARLLPRGAPRAPGGSRTRGGAERAALDPVGLGLLSGGLLLLLLPLIEGQSLGWPLWTFVSLAAAAAVLAGFWVWELRIERGGGRPIVPPELLQRRAFAAGTLVALVYFAAFTSVFFTLSILWQTGLGRGALSAGLTMLPFALGSLVSATVSDRVSARLGRGVLFLGAGMVAVGLAGVVAVLRLTAPDPQGWQLLVPLAVAGLGSGLFIAPNTDFILAAVPRDQAGAASGVLSTAQRVGSAIGVALIGTVLFGTLRGADAAAFTTSATLATLVNVGLILLALALIPALPKRPARGVPEKIPISD